MALRGLGGLGCCGFTLPGFGCWQGNAQSLRYLVQSIHFTWLRRGSLLLHVWSIHAVAPTGLIDANRVSSRFNMALECII